LRTKNSPKVANIGYCTSTPTDAAEREIMLSVTVGFYVVGWIEDLDGLYRISGAAYRDPPPSARCISRSEGTEAGSSSFRALSAPTTGNDPASSRPTCTKTEAWSQ
jgi:hypothetical protein